MKTTFRTRALFLGAIILGAALFAGRAAAAVIVQMVNQSGADANGWASAIWGTPAAVANNSNDYETTNTFFVRTPNNSTPAAFAGKSLTIDSGGTLYLKHNGGAATVNLVMNGGAITFHGGTAVTPSPLAGTIQVLADSRINSDQGLPNNRDIWLQSPISGNANMTVAMNIATNGVFLSGSNSAYSGNWTNSGGFIQIVSGSTNALGSGGVILVNANNSLILNSTNNFAINNGISGLGSVVKQNTNTVSLNGNNTFTGPVQITNGVLKIGAGSSLSSASTISLLGGALDASLIGGLTLNPAGQNMNCNGTVIGNLTAATANTNNFTLTPTTNNILNVTGSLTLNGNPALNLLLSGYKPSGVYRLINYSGTIQGGGAFNLVPPVGSTETFQLDTITPGQVNLIITGISHNLIWVGDNAANNWDTTSPNWSGDATLFSLGDNVTFNDSGSAVPNIYVPVAVSPSSMTVSNTSQKYTFDFAGISTSGTLTKAGANELDFTSNGNNFSGPINIQSGMLSIGAGGSFGSLGSPSSITNNGVLQVNLAANGVALNAPISGSGALQITGGGASVTLGGPNSYTGLTTIGDGCQLNISSSSALGSTNAGTIVLANGRLGVASAVGSMTVAEPVTINGTGIGAAPGALYVNTSGNNVTWAGPVTIASDSRIRAVNVNVRMNFSNTVLGTNVALECTSGSTAGDVSTVMTFQNTLSLGGSGSLNADGLAVVVLAGGANVWGGGTTVANGTLLVNGQLDCGAVTVNSSGTLGGSGTILGSVSVSGATLAPGNAGSGIGTLTISNSVTFDSTSTNVMELNRTNAQNADLLSAASLACDGTLTVTNIGNPLQAGDTFQLFSGVISGAFAVTNLPALSSTNLYWDTSLLASGILKVGSSVAPRPLIVSPIASGPNFTLQVPDSVSGFSYVVQATPSLAPPTWTGIQTNAGSGGTLTFTIPITPGIPQQFFRISVQ